MSGKVKVKLPGSKNYIDLSQAANLPVGTTVDTRDGRVTILAAGKGGQADFFDGIFKISQTNGLAPAHHLTLTETLSCPKKGKASAAAAKKKTPQAVGRGQGRVPDGRQVQRGDRAGHDVARDRQLRPHDTKVTQGSVNVRDNVKKRTVIARKGKTYTARAKK